MKKIIYLIIFLSVNIYSQSPFSEGYSKGFKEGYCYRIYQCIDPITPITPLPLIDEDSRSFKHGYQRGFLDGRKTKDNKGLKNNERYNENTVNQFTKREYGEYIEPYDTDFLLKAFEMRAKNQHTIREINANIRRDADKTLEEKEQRDRLIYKFYQSNKLYEIIELENIEFNIDKETTIYSLRKGWQIDDSTPFFKTKNSCYIYKQWRGSINKRNLNIIYTQEPHLKKNPFFYNGILNNMGLKYRGTVFLNTNKEIVFYSMETTSRSNIKSLKKHSKIKRKIKLSKLKNKPKGLISLYRDSKKNRYLFSLKNSYSKYPYKNIIFDLENFKKANSCQMQNMSNYMDDAELNKLYNFLKSIK